MKAPSLLAAAALAASSILSACGGGSTGSAPAGALPSAPAPSKTQSAIAALFARTNPAKINHHHGWMKPHLTGPLVYVSDGSTNQVLVYQAGVNNPSPVGSIQYTLSNPGSLWVDSYGDLFVCNIGTNSVQAFFPGRLEPYLIVNLPQGNPGTFPTGVSVDIYGNLWVSHSSSLAVEYGHGTTTAVRTISNSLVTPSGIALQGVFTYVSQRGSNGQGGVVKIKPGWTIGLDMHLQQLGAVVGAVELGSKNELYVADTLNSRIQVYPTGRVNPTITITDGLARPQQMAFDANFGLYVTNVFGGNVTYYAKDATTASNTIATGLSSPTGVAVTGQQH